MNSLLRIPFYKFWIKWEKQQQGGEELGPEREQGKEAEVDREEKEWL